MKLKIIGVENRTIKDRDLPNQFNEEIRPDLVKRAVLVIHANKRQPYGVYPEAGKRAVAYVSKRRRDYKTTYGIGQSRTPRKVMSHRGSRFNWTGAFAPQTVGGRRSHPPKAEKSWHIKINKKERKKAIRSAIAATLKKELVQQRGHVIPNEYPFAVEQKLENLKKAKEVQNVLAKIGLKEELSRVNQKTIRHGRGKSRGRKYKSLRGILVVVSKDCNLLKSAKNIPGIEVVKVINLNAEVLAPGFQMGRLTIWTDASLDTLEKQKLFT